MTSLELSHTTSAVFNGVGESMITSPREVLTASTRHLAISAREAFTRINWPVVGNTALQLLGLGLFLGTAVYGFRKIFTNPKPITFNS